MLFTTTTAISTSKSINVIDFDCISHWFPRSESMFLVEITDLNEIDFDLAIYNNIINNDHIFREFMEIILIPYYSCQNMMIFIRSEFNVYYQGFLKFLEVRYGITTHLINDQEDFDSISYLVGTNNISKIEMYDEDFKRYIIQRGSEYGF